MSTSYMKPPTATWSPMRGWRAHGAHVGEQGLALVVDDVEALPRGVLTGRGADPLAQLGLGVAGHGAPGVGDDEDALDPEQVHAEDERLEGVGGDAAAGVAEDLGVAGRRGRAAAAGRCASPCR